MAGTRPSFRAPSLLPGSFPSSADFYLVLKHMLIAHSRLLVFYAIWHFSIDRLGRTPVILAASVVFAVGSVVMGAADGKEALLVGRIVVGIGIGMWAVKCFSAFQQWTKAQQSIDPPTACACVCVYPVATRVVVPRRMRQLIILRVSSTLSFLPPMSPGTRVNIIVMKKMRLADSATA